MDRVKRIQLGLEQCRLHEGRKVLHLQCGTGEFSLYMARAGCTVVAVDRDVSYASKHNKNKNLSYIAGDITNICLDEKFDIIVLDSVLHRIAGENYIPLMKNLYEHGYDTALLYVVTPFWHWQLFKRRFKLEEKEETGTVFSIQTLLNLFEASNYWPMSINIFGFEQPLEEIEFILARREDIYIAWSNFFRHSLGVPEDGDGFIKPAEEGDVICQEHPKGSIKE